MPAVKWAAVLAVIGTAALAHAAEEPRRPSVVLLIVDTLRADMIGALDHTDPPAPELETLVKRGVRFDRVIAQSTWTRPSIGSMLTSRYPRTLGLYRESEQALPREIRTLAEVLHDAGYRTVGATANANINAYFHFDQGFDVYFDSAGIFRFMPGYDPAKRRRTPLAPEVLDKVLGAVRARDARPFYIQVNLMEAHYARPLCSQASPGPRSERACYVEAVRRVSRDVARFLESLLALPGFERTLVSITSDHGETLFGEHPSVAEPRWHGHLVYPTQALVPWILFDTAGRLPAGRVVEQPVRLLELMPTLLELAGVPVPTGLDGRSLVPLLRENRLVELPSGFVVETEMRGFRKIAVYDGDWVFVRNRDGHPGTDAVELQRLDGPCDGARSNQAAREPARARSLSEQLERWEAAYPRRAPVAPAGPSADETLEQLRALGYVD